MTDTNKTETPDPAVRRLQSRYITYKKTDAQRLLNEEEGRQLAFLLNKIEQGRASEDKAPLTGLFIESDWPEHDEAAAAIFARIYNDNRPTYAKLKLVLAQMAHSEHRTMAYIVAALHALRNQDFDTAFDYLVERFSQCDDVEDAMFENEQTTDQAFKSFLDLLTWDFPLSVEDLAAINDKRALPVSSWKTLGYLTFTGSQIRTIADFAALPIKDGFPLGGTDDEIHNAVYRFYPRTRVQMDGGSVYTGPAICCDEYPEEGYQPLSLDPQFYAKGVL